VSIEGLRRRLGLPLAVLAFSSWPTVPIDSVPVKFRDLFKVRLKACELYCSEDLGARAVAERVGLSPSQVLRLACAAFRPHADGGIYGQRGLLPYLHFDVYTRHQEGGAGTAGIFKQLLRRFPDIQAQIVDAYCRRGKRLKDIHKSMLRSLGAKGVGALEYPFNASREGSLALREFCKGLEGERFRDIALNRYGSDAARRADTSEGREVVRHILRPYTRVEVDAHTLDAIFILRITGPNGQVRKLTLRRLIWIVVLDVASRALLGHYLSFNKTESCQDILAAIERALSNSPPLAITEPGLSIRADSGLPVNKIPNCAYRAIDEFAFDNSLAARSPALQSKLMMGLGARVNLGKSASPEGRAFVESFFKKMTENGFQRLPSTTGNSPDSPKRRNPEEKAHYFELTSEAAEQIAEVLGAEYNNTDHGVTNCTPLDYIRTWDESGGLIRRIPQAQRGLEFLREMELRLTVRGSADRGERPYVQWEDAKYRNPRLAQYTKMIGSKIIAIVDIRNVAVMRIFLPIGEPLGILKAQGRWGLSPHSLKTRRAILRRERNGELPLVSADPIENYVADLTARASKNRAAANELARIRRERGDGREPARNISSPETASALTNAAEDMDNLASEYSGAPGAISALNRSDGPPSRETVPGQPDLDFALTLGMDIQIQRNERR